MNSHLTFCHLTFLMTTTKSSTKWIVIWQFCHLTFLMNTTNFSTKWIVIWHFVTWHYYSWFFYQVGSHLTSCHIFWHFVRTKWVVSWHFVRNDIWSEMTFLMTTVVIRPFQYICRYYNLHCARMYHSLCYNIHCARMCHSRYYNIHCARMYHSQSYGVATVSRIDEITGLFCRIWSLL